MAKCKVKLFRATWGDWDISWRYFDSGKSTILLPVSFRLELESSCDKSDCAVGQLMQGKSSNGAGTDVFETWRGDGPNPAGIWWAGDGKWLNGKGEWDKTGRIATFADHPGHKRAPGSIYMGDATGGPGYFDFRTFVRDRITLEIVQEIKWSMRIDVPNPGKGGRWWSYSDQK